MKIAVISDLHGNLLEYNFSDVELLLICGDFSPLNIQMDIPKMKQWLCTKFTTWCVSMNIPKVVFIAGNHDFISEKCDDWMHKIFPKSSIITYLNNEIYDYISNDSKVYRIFGTPYCKQFGNWAFMRNSEILKEKFREIPDNTDILISHDAPKIAELGCIKDEGMAWYGKDAGNFELAQAIKEHKPKYVFCGHIHSGQKGLQTIDGIKMTNVSILNERYEVTYEPLILTL